MQLSDGDVFSDPSGGSYEVIDSGDFDLHGGFGYVYFVKDQNGKTVVAKIPNLNQQEPKHVEMVKSRLRTEGRFIKELQDANVPNIVGYIDCFEASVGGNDIPILILEVARGVTITDWITANGEMPEPQVKRVLEELCNAVRGVHAANMIHRDIKSPNVFMNGTPENPEITLIDFGISAQFDNSSTHATGTNLMHSLFYAPPEQITHTDARPSTDTFAIGAIGYELLVGRNCGIGHPGGKKSRYNPREDSPVDNNGEKTVSEEFAQVIVKATWDTPGQRYMVTDDLILAIRGRPLIENMPRIIADNKPWPIDDDEIWICRKSAGLHNLTRIMVSELTDPDDGDRMISRWHAVILKGSDGVHRIFDKGVPRPIDPNVLQSTNRTVWRREGSQEWRELPPNGLALVGHYLEIGLGYTKQAPNAKDANGDPLLPGAYQIIQYAPPDNLDSRL